MESNRKNLGNKIGNYIFNNIKQVKIQQTYQKLWPLEDASVRRVLGIQCPYDQHQVSKNPNTKPLAKGFLASFKAAVDVVVIPKM